MSGRKTPTVLLVEDNPADAGLVQEALEEHRVDCDLILATDGERAIRFIESINAHSDSCPDLIILDLNLPRRTGREVLELIRGNDKCAEVPIVILTSSNAQIDRDDAMKLGATRYIKKPSRLAEFLKLGSLFKEILNLPLS